MSIEVALEPRAAFELFTSGIGEWWPYKTHFNRGNVESLIFESRLGGELKEVCADGVVETYGKVLAWEPPERVVIKWMVALWRGPATEVEVRFSPTLKGTRLDLEHRGFEAYGEGPGTGLRDGYRNGWPGVLRLFAEHASNRSKLRRSADRP